MNKCKWLEPFNYICFNGLCEHCADVCIIDEEKDYCRFYESEEKDNNA